MSSSVKKLAISAIFVVSGLIAYLAGFTILALLTLIAGVFASPLLQEKVSPAADKAIEPGTKAYESNGFREIKPLINEFIPALSECESNISAIKSTQDDAVDTLSSCFVTLQRLINSQIDIINKSQANTEITHKLEQVSQELREKLNETIRGLQFGDINGQNLSFTKNTISFIRSKLAATDADNILHIVQQVHEHVEAMKTRQHEVRNPVSHKNMDAGEIDFF